MQISIKFMRSLVPAVIAAAFLVAQSAKGGTNSFFFNGPEDPTTNGTLTVYRDGDTPVAASNAAVWFSTDGRPTDPNATDPSTNGYFSITSEILLPFRAASDISFAVLRRAGWAVRGPRCSKAWNSVIPERTSAANWRKNRAMSLAFAPPSFDSGAFDVRGSEVRSVTALWEVPTVDVPFDGVGITALVL